MFKIIFIHYFSYCAIFFVLAFLVTYKIPLKDVKYEEFLETIKKSGRKVELVNNDVLNPCFTRSLLFQHSSALSSWRKQTLLTKTDISCL